MIRQRASLLHLLLRLAVSAVVQPEQLQVARGRCPRRGPKPCLFWLHIQKTGTAFGATLAAASFWACSCESCPAAPSSSAVSVAAGRVAGAIPALRAAAHSAAKARSAACEQKRDDCGAAAWRAALRVGADDPPRSLSAVCGVAVAVQQGLFDGVSAEDAAVKVDKLLAALPETSVDATKALSDADLSALKAAAVEALES